MKGEERGERRYFAPHRGGDPVLTLYAPLALPAPSILTLSRVELAGVAGRHAEGQSAHGEGAHRAEGWHLALEGNNKRRESASARSSLLKLGWTHGAWDLCVPPVGAAAPQPQIRPAMPPAKMFAVWQPGACHPTQKGVVCVRSRSKEEAGTPC